MEAMMKDWFEAWWFLEFDERLPTLTKLMRVVATFSFIAGMLVATGVFLIFG